VLLDDISAQWLATLRADGAVRDDAHARLHELLLRIARGEAARRSAQIGVTGAELDDLAHQAAADAMLAVLGKLDTFRGESRFTTWAYTFVMFEVSAKIGRHFWRRPPVPLELADWDRLPARFGFSAEQESESRDLLRVLRDAIDHELTERQRRVFRALVLDGVPLDALVVELDSNRNAVYKMLFDARVRLRATLVAKGFLEEMS
jgi:RNA polymerase sigma-70 factor (ECF subfamily)